MSDLAQRVIDHAKEYDAKKRPDGWRKADEGAWRMSQIGMCARQQGYAYLGIPQDFDDASRSNEKTMSLSDGHVHEHEIADRIAALPFVKVESENKPYKKVFKNGNTRIRLYGTPDMVIEDHGIRKVVEIKALQNAAFEESKSKGEAPEKYVRQLMGYLILLDLTVGDLYIKNRNNSEVMSFTVELTPEKRSEMLKRQFNIQAQVDEEKLPPQEYMVGSQECFYCAWSRTCWPTNDFKGYIHKKGAEKGGITIDLDEEPKSKTKFLLAVKLYEKASRKIKELQEQASQAKEELEALLTRHKATGLVAGGYSAKRVETKRTEPDKDFMKGLVESGKVPMVTKESSYLRVDLPKGGSNGA